MTDKQPEALRLAAELECVAYSLPSDRRGYTEDGNPQNCCTDAAAELRRLHAENEALRAMSFDTKRDMKTEALLWLAREMIRELPVVHSEQGPRRDELIQALNERLK